MEITYYGHSCVGVQVGGKNLLFDPFISGNQLAESIDISKIKADYILISHGHEDHLADAALIAKHTKAIVISNYEIGEWLASKQHLQKRHSMNIGGTWKFDFGTVKMVSAIHSSSLPDGTYGGNPGGFVVDSTEGVFYFAGDTALTYDMKLINQQGKLKFAFLPIGDNFTMGIKDAIQAADFINCDTIIGIHFDTFDPIKINHAEAKEQFSKAGKTLTLLKIGEVIKM